MDCSDWPDDRRQHYENLNEDFKFFATSDLKLTRQTIYEFPPPPRSERARKRKIIRKTMNNRRSEKNALCSCGSGKPYRLCHMSR